MLLVSLIVCLFGALVPAEPPLKAKPVLPKVKLSKTLLSPVRPLPCHSVTMIKDARPTEFLFIAPGNSGDCSFIFEGSEGGRLDIKVRNLKSNLPRGNGDPCEDGQVRLYNYKGSGQITLSQRLCDNEKEVTMLTDSNMAIVASSLIDGSFSVVARSVRQADLLAGEDAEFLTPPETSTHDWTTKSPNPQDLPKEEKMEDNKDNQVENDEVPDDNNNDNKSESPLDDSNDNVKEPSLDETPPADVPFEPNYFVVRDANMTDMNNTKSNCSYNPYGYYVCNYNNSSNHTGNSNHTGYYYTPSPVYHSPHSTYSSPYHHEPIYEAPKPEYKPPSVNSSPNPVYSPPPTYSTYPTSHHVYSPPVYSPPNPTYSAPSNYYSAPDNLYSAPGSSYNSPDHEYSNHYQDYDHHYEKPFKPSQPIPNDYWEGYDSPQSSYYRAPVWYDEKGPYPGKPTKHVDLTHDTYPMYPSYYNPGYYYPNSKASSTTPHSLTTSSTTKSPSKRTTLNEQKTTVTSPPTTTKPTTTTKKHHHFFGFDVPWTANVSITSGDNLETSAQEDNQQTTSTTAPRIQLNRIINNLPKSL